MIARARILYRRWQRVRTLRRVQAEMGAWIPSVRDMSLPRFYRHYLRGSRKLGQAMRATALTADEASQAIAQLGQSTREMDAQFFGLVCPNTPYPRPGPPQENRSESI